MISKYAEKFNMLAEKKKFTEIFPFEAYHRSEKLEKLELTKEKECDFRNSTPKLPKGGLYIADPKNCVDKCNILN